eukprot:TRINITY_DN305_c0_g1_i2.p1 TRINITY_DN305_c0_g1~~TRINITY_DN305_c0_g1_i2.p1  ORF type:complete len:604 (-),score=182.10 TRINITY_DN305_c0_g1_i2:84-1895(-)
MSFQGGEFYEVFSNGGSQPLSSVKLVGPGRTIFRVFDKTCKSFVIQIDGHMKNRLILPKDEKTPLGLIQPYLCVQIHAERPASLYFELTITDHSRSKRRLIMSSAFKEFSVTPLHAQIPLTSVVRGVWTNLVFNVKDIAETAFKKSKFATLDFLSIGPECKVRKIFTLRERPFDTTSPERAGLGSGPAMEIPRKMDFIAAIPSCTEVLMLEDLHMVPPKKEDVNVRPGTGSKSPGTKLAGRGGGAGGAGGAVDKHETSSTVGSTPPKKTFPSVHPRSGGTTHIAFGSRVPVPAHGSSMEESGNDPDRAGGGRHVEGSTILRQFPSYYADGGSLTESQRYMDSGTGYEDDDVEEMRRGNSGTRPHHEKEPMYDILEPEDETRYGNDDEDDEDEDDDDDDNDVGGDDDDDEMRDEEKGMSSSHHMSSSIMASELSPTILRSREARASSERRSGPKVNASVGPASPSPTPDDSLVHSSASIHYGEYHSRNYEDEDEDEGDAGADDVDHDGEHVEKEVREDGQPPDTTDFMLIMYIPTDAGPFDWFLHEDAAEHANDLMDVRVFIPHFSQKVKGVLKWSAIRRHLGIAALACCSCVGGIALWIQMSQ